MSDISFPGLGAFVIFLGLLIVLGLTLIFSLVRLLRAKRRWPCHSSFGFGIGSAVGFIITLILLYLTENGSVAFMKILDEWAMAIVILILVNNVFMGWWFWRKNSKRR